MSDSFNDWLSPSPIELNQISVLENCIRAGKKKEARNLLSRCEMQTLIKYTELSLVISNFLQQAKQDSLWRQHLANFKDDSFTLKEYPPLSISQLIKGNFYYWKASECRKEDGEPFKKNELEFLVKSMFYYSFHACNSLSTWAYEKYRAGTKEAVLLAELYALEASKYHWTPGYLLLYKTYLNVATLNEGSIFFYQKALEALIVAYKLSKHPYSIDAINNAYFGNGLISGSKVQFTSWEKSISDIISRAGIPAALINTIYEKAAEIVHHILSEAPAGKDNEISDDELATNNIWTRR